MQYRACSRCHENKPTHEFAFKNKSKGLVSSVCKECKRKDIQKHYQDNKTYYVNKSKENKKKGVERNKRLRDAFLEGKSCAGCGTTETKLTFSPKNRDLPVPVANLIRYPSSVDTLIEAFNKCELLCVACTLKKRRN